VRSHIVPKLWLRPWSADGHVDLLPAGRTSPAKRTGLKRAVSELNYYPAAYREEIEGFLNEIESPAATLLRSIDDAWPLPSQDKFTVARLVALQLVRGPNIRDWHELKIDEERGAFVERLNQRFPQHGPSPLLDRHLDQAVERFKADATSRDQFVLDIKDKIAGVLASMHWTLVEFGSARLATSDDPVVPWAVDDRGLSRVPGPREIGRGLTECLEIWTPLTPQRLLLMTWLDREADMCRKAPAHLAATCNTFQRDQAINHWVAVPGRPPKVAAPGPMQPLSTQLRLDYDLRAAAESQRRGHLLELLKPLVGRRVTEIPYVRVEETTV
jgi:hypothetical protein